MRQKRRKRSYKRLWQAGILFMVILAAGLGLFSARCKTVLCRGRMAMERIALYML